MADTDPRILELEDGLKEAERRLAEMRAERDEARDLVQRMEQHVSDGDVVIEQWIEAFEMQLNDDGKWSQAENLAEQFYTLKVKYVELLKDWNRFVPKYNAAIAPKQIGRPLDASPAQCALVIKLKKGEEIAASDCRRNEFRPADGAHHRWTRGADRPNIHQKYDPDNAAVMAAKARKRTRDALPKRIGETLAQGAVLLKEAKGLGK